MKRSPIRCALLVLAITGCSHEVVRMNEAAFVLEPMGTPIGMTVAVREGPFEDVRISPRGVVERFAEALAEAEIFQGNLYPIPAGEKPRWQLEVSGSDRAYEPDGNFWKSFFVTVLFPLTPFVTFENEYSLELRALLLHRRELIQTYTAVATIRHRYKLYADRQVMEEEGFEAVVYAATQTLIGAIRRDENKLRAWNDELF